MKYIVVIGNLSHIVGPFDTRLKAEAYTARFDLFSESYNPGRWTGYSVTIVPIYPPTIEVA